MAVRMKIACNFYDFRRKSHLDRLTVMKFFEFPDAQWASLRRDSISAVFPPRPWLLSQGSWHFVF